ncbi:MAG: TRAP transporter substrate-binding protein [Rhodospirillaceae bacterium]|nr:TRAP transporter substrate-binding protein [Rhodospirillaceae bacterium]
MLKHFAGAAAIVALTAGVAGAQTKWDLPTAYPATNFHTENIAAFAKDVDQATGGKLKITVHPGASLFKAPEIKRAVQGNQAQAGEILLVNFENENALYGADGVPFLASSYAEAKKLWGAQKPMIAALLAKQGMAVLFSVPWPPQGIYSKKAIASAADMKGLKFRSYSPATSRLAELFHAQPVTIQAAELTQAMATGVVESFITSGSTGYDTKAYEHIKFFYDTQAWLPKNAVIVNKKAWDALGKTEQDAVTKAAAAAEARGWKSSEDKNSWYLDQLKAKGMAVEKPTAQLTADLKKAGETLLADWLKKAGDDGRKLVAAYKKM